MKPLSVEMACLLGIQNEIQAVWNDTNQIHTYEYAKCKNKIVRMNELVYFGFYQMRIDWQIDIASLRKCKYFFTDFIKCLLIGR